MRPRAVSKDQDAACPVWECLLQNINTKEITTNKVDFLKTLVFPDRIHFFAANIGDNHHLFGTISRIFSNHVFQKVLHVIPPAANDEVTFKPFVHVAPPCKDCFFQKPC
ncbi:MAG: hypothetical protein EBU49_07510 [Proteobacteria bacterium]|nr:hypothetical protein [Pseudomonadota bacterium]